MPEPVPAARGDAAASLSALPGVTPLSSLLGAPPSSAPVPQAAPPQPSTPQRSASAVPAATDAGWSRAFGSINAASTGYAVAVAQGVGGAGAAGATDDPGATEIVYLGGDFIGPMAGLPEQTFVRIARWDGTGWQRMGEGLDGTVRAIAVDAESVYVGGEFNVAGRSAAARLARWDGTAWTAVSGGVSSTQNPMGAAVKALACDGTTLYVAGAFDRVGQGKDAVDASGIAALDLASGTWRAFGAGLRFQDGPGEGRALLLSGGRLYVGGWFDSAGGAATGSFAAIDLTTRSWTAFGAGVRSGDFIGAVDSLAADAGSGTVYVGGSFTAAGDVTTSGVATLSADGWGTLGPFLRYGDASSADVMALAYSGGRLYVGGEFTTAGNAAAERWAVHDGRSWSVPGDGVDNVVRALAPLRGGVAVAGDFVFSGSLRVPYAAVWTGTGWETFGQGLSYDPFADANAYAAAVTATAVYVGGYFDQAGALPVGSVAAWTGRWQALAGGVRNGETLGTIYGLALLGDDLYVTGSFSSAAGATTANIARWDGTTWSALGSGLDDTGYAIAVLGGRLYAGGRFRAAGATSANGVAAWDPATGSWSQIGNAPAFDDAVLGLGVIADRYLVIGGQYTALSSGGTDLVRGLNGLTIFDTAAAVDPQDPLSGFLVLAGVQHSGGTGTVRALHVLGGDLYVGGTFDTAGVVAIANPPQPGFAAANLAVWHVGGDGSWSTPGGADQPVMALTSRGDVLLVGGWFGTAGPITASGVAEYRPVDGTWTTYGSGVGGGERGTRHVEALAVDPARGTWVGGTFDTAGGFPSCGIALWTSPGPTAP